MTPEMAQQWGAIAVSVIIALEFAAALVIAYLAKDQANLGILLGIVGGGFNTVIGFWIGSSAGSQRKTEMLATQPEGKPR